MKWYGGVGNLNVQEECMKKIVYCYKRWNVTAMELNAIAGNRKYIMFMWVFWE